MKGNWQEYNEQFMPTSTRNDYDTDPLKQASDAWKERARGVKQRDVQPLDYRAEASVKVLPDRQTLKISRLEVGKDGYAAVPVRKAEAKQPTCILCSKQASEEDRHTVFGQTIHAHGTCIASLERSLRGVDVRQVPATRVPVDINPALKSRGGLTEAEERLGKRDAVFLVSTLASMLREQGY